MCSDNSHRFTTQSTKLALDKCVKFGALVTFGAKLKDRNYAANIQRTKLSLSKYSKTQHITVTVYNRCI